MIIKKKGLLALSLCALFLNGCARKETHEISEYILNYDMGSKTEFKILQLSDIHVADKDDRDRQFAYLNSIIDTANADMIVVTGDLFTFASRHTAKELFSVLDSHNIPWTVTFGNHDEQCYFSIDWLTEYLNNYGSNCLFKDIHNDDVYGYANFGINIMKDGTLFNQVIMMDSNRYNYGEYVGYDYIKEDQIKWYERLVTYTKSVYGDYDSQAFFHIPLCEFNEAYKAYEDGDTSVLVHGTKTEKTCSPDVNTGLFDKMYELGSTKSVNCGHDHLNNSVLLYKGIYLAYGIHSSDRIYFNEDLIGGRVITIHNDKSLEFNDILLSYED